MPNYDDTDRPLIRMSLARAGDADVGAAFADHMDSLLTAGQHFVLVLDERMALALSSRYQWRRVRAWALRRRRQLGRACVAVAVTATEAALPQVERATRRLARMIPAPLSIFVEATMAEQWVHSRFATDPRRLAPAPPDDGWARRAVVTRGRRHLLSTPRRALGSHDTR